MFILYSAQSNINTYKHKYIKTGQMLETIQYTHQTPQMIMESEGNSGVKSIQLIIQTE